MDGYTGTAYNMSQCLTPSAQSQLDEILASTYGYIFTGQFSEVKSAYENFLLTLANDCGECGLTKVESSLKVGLQTKGKIWYEVNLVYNAKKVEESLQTFYSQITSKNFQAAGTTVGQLTDLLIPYESSPVNLNSFLDFNTAAYQTWWKGLVQALAINSKSQGPCAKFLLNFANTTIPVFTDITELHSKNMAGFNTLFGDATKPLSYIQTSYTTDFCDFDLLLANIQDLFSQTGLLELASRYATKASLINSSIVNIKNCDLNAYACGQAYGYIIKYLLNWAIN